MRPEPEGYLRSTSRGSATAIATGSTGRALLPDPASRCQPEGPLGPSMIVDPGRYRLA